MDFKAVLPPFLVRKIVALLCDDLEDKRSLMRVDRAFFGYTVAGVLLETEEQTEVLVPLFGSALKRLHWCVPEHDLMRLADYEAVLRRCDEPIPVTFNFLNKTAGRRRKDIRLFLALLALPMVRSLDVPHFRAFSEDACAVLAHPKFVVDDNGELELNDFPLTAAALAKLADAASLNVVVLRPLCLHHLDVIPFCTPELRIFPQGASAAVEAAAAQFASAGHPMWLTYAYETEADVRILRAMLSESDDYVALTIKSDATQTQTLSRDAEDGFFKALSRVRVKDDVNVSLGAEIACPELAIEALACAFDNYCADTCNVSIACCTPLPCEDARALLGVESTPSSRFTITATPRLDGTGPLTDAWMWDAMAHASVRAEDGSSLALYGGCADNGARAETMALFGVVATATSSIDGTRIAYCAGKAMGRTRFTAMHIMCRSADTAWMAPFIQGFMEMTLGATQIVGLYAGKANDDDGDVDGMRPVARPDVQAAVDAANSAGPAEWTCLEAC